MLLPHVEVSATLRDGFEDESNKMYLEHGAVLYRGFNFTTPEAIATFQANNPGLKCLHDYFPAEHGRDEVYVSSRSGFTVWPTNSLTLTGGYLTPEVVPHTENYYAVRGIPDEIAFCCERAPWFGGETALFNGFAAFGALPIPLQQKLEQPCAIRRFLSWERLFERHGIASEAELQQQLDGTGARQLPLPASSGYVGLEFPREVEPGARREENAAEAAAGAARSEAEAELQAAHLAEAAAKERAEELQHARDASARAVTAEAQMSTEGGGGGGCDVGWGASDGSLRVEYQLQHVPLLKRYWMTGPRQLGQILLWTFCGTIPLCRLWSSCIVFWPGTLLRVHGFFS